MNNAAPRDDGDLEMVQENQGILGMEEDVGTEDGLHDMIADMCKGKRLRGDMFYFTNEHLNCMVSLTSKYTQFTFVVKLPYTKSFPWDQQ